MVRKDLLAHHGVKGMKWGVRKAEKMQNKYAASLSDTMYYGTSKSYSKMSKIDKTYRKAQGEDSIKMIGKKSKNGQKYVELFFKDTGSEYVVFAEGLIRRK